MNERKKGLIWLIIILVILVLCIVGNIIYKKVTFVEQGTKEEIIKQNFLNDIKLVKKGKGTEQQKYLLCDDIYDCKKIDEFSIDSIEFYENGEDNQPVYKFELSWSCKGDGECFYNEQYGYNNDTKMNEVKTFYKVDENNRIITGLGNSYDFKDDEEYTADWIGTAFDLEDKANVDMHSDFKNVNTNVGKFNFTLNCIGYNIQGGNTCDLVEILINDKSYNIKSSVQEENAIIVSKDVLVNTTYGSSKGTMKVISENGNVIYENEVVIDYETKNTNWNDGTPVLEDNKLYFYTQKDDNTIIKNYLDFKNGFDEIQVEEIEGKVSNL